MSALTTLLASPALLVESVFSKALQLGSQLCRMLTLLLHGLPLSRSAARPSLQCQSDVDNGTYHYSTLMTQQQVCSIHKIEPHKGRWQLPMRSGKLCKQEKGSDCVMHLMPLEFDPSSCTLRTPDLPRRFFPLFREALECSCG